MKELERKIEKIYNALIQANICAEYIEQFEENKSKIEKEKERIASAGGCWLFIVVGVFIVIGFFGGFILGAIFMGIIGLILSFIIFAITEKTSYSTKKKEERAQEYYDCEMKKLMSAYNANCTKLDVLLKGKELAEMDKIIPEDYQNLFALEKILKYIRNNRAETLKEAFNLYEDELHKMSIIEMQQKQVQLAEDALERQEEEIALSELTLNEYQKQSAISARQLQQLKKLNKK